MKTPVISIALLALCASISAFAAGPKTLNYDCGVNTHDNREIRVNVVLTQKDKFSSPVIVEINGQKLRENQVDKTDARHFGPKGYEWIKIKLNEKKEPVSATYSHYNSQSPYNPMEDLTLECFPSEE